MMDCVSPHIPANDLHKARAAVRLHMHIPRPRLDREMCIAGWGIPVGTRGAVVKIRKELQIDRSAQCLHLKKMQIKSANHSGLC